MRRLLLSLTTGLGLLAAPLAAQSAPKGSPRPASHTPACPGCEVLLEQVAANPKRQADRARDAARHIKAARDAQSRAPAKLNRTAASPSVMSTRKSTRPPLSIRCLCICGLLLDAPFERRFEQ